MRKIVVKFNKLKDIENLKKIMRNVYASSSDHLPDIAKFHLGDKIFMLSQVDKAELYIITANGTEIIAFSKALLSFYLGVQHPFTKVAMTSEDEGNYIAIVMICCRYEEDTKKIKEVLVKRLEKCKLKLNEEKTKMVKFSKRKLYQGVKQETFDFLGFTWYLGKSRKGIIKSVNCFQLILSFLNL